METQFDISYADQVLIVYLNALLDHEVKCESRHKGIGNEFCTVNAVARHNSCRYRMRLICQAQVDWMRERISDPRKTCISCGGKCKKCWKIFLL